MARKLTPERWKEIERLYQLAREMDPREREALLTEASAGDASIQKEVEALLADQSRIDRLMESPAMEVAAEVLAQDQAFARIMEPNNAGSPLGMTLERGELLGPYEIIALIGAGGMGQVYKARDTRLGRVVAVKVLPPAFASDPKRRRRFEHEARAVSALNHPHICILHDIGSSSPKSAGAPPVDYLVMEFVEGETLAERLRQGRLPPAQALEYGAQIADALGRAHSQGIFHRDLKPANIMLTNSGAKLLDFGLAKLKPATPADRTADTSAFPADEPTTTPGSYLGTIPYMAPEQVEGKETDARTDLFAFGTVLYEMVTGRRAFEGESPASIAAAILEHEPPSLSSLQPLIQPALEHLVARCLAKEPDARWQSAADLAGELQWLASGSQTDHRKQSRAGTLSGLAPVLKKRRQWLLPAALATMVLLLAGVLWIWQTRQTKPPAHEPVLKRLTSDSGLTMEPALSPDGKLLVYASDRSGEGNLDLWLQQIPGGPPLRLTHEKADAHEPSFSPDGTKIAYRSERDGGTIWVIPALGGDARKIAGNGHSPRFSPDGTRIVYWTGLLGTLGPRASSYVVPADGGTPKPLVPDFSYAFDAGWSADGRWILFFGGPKGGKPRDYWVVPADGGAPARTGVMTAFFKAKLALPRMYHRPAQWLGDRLLFSARLGDSTNLWEIPMSPETREATGEPRRLTYGAGEDFNPFLAGGRLVFASTSMNSDIWSLPIDPNEGKILGGLERLTRDAATDFFPFISADGKKVAFFSDRSGSIESWLKDLETGKETALTRLGPGTRTRAILSSDGTRAYYQFTEFEGGKPKRSMLHILDMEKNTDTELIPIGDKTGGILDYSTGLNRLLGMGQGGSPRGLISIDAASFAPVFRLKHSRYSLSDGRFSPDGSWIAFRAQMQIESSLSLIFVAAYREGRPPEEKEWIAVTDESALNTHPAWSPDGGMIYFISNRDGFRCLWAQRLDPRTKKPAGEPMAIYHLHRAGLLMPQPEQSEPLSIGVARDKIVVNLREATGNIWMTSYR